MLRNMAQNVYKPNDAWFMHILAKIRHKGVTRITSLNYTRAVCHGGHA